MRFLHVADTHLGFQAYRAVDGDGFNRRETDVYEAFAAAIDHALEREVDLVVHAGDLFDSVRPTNRAIGEALDQVQRLRAAGIPLVVIAGNHETPRLKETGHVFRLLEFFDDVHPIYGRGVETVEVAGVTVHAVPHVADQETFEAELAGLDPGAGRNVLVLHGTVPGIEGLPSGEFNDLTVPPEVFDGFDYVALGHYHVRHEVRDHVWYAGSTERLSFAEAHVDKGCLLVDPDGPDVEPLMVSARPMVSPPPIDCSGLSADDVTARIEEALEGDLDGALVKVKLQQLPKDVHQALDLGRLRSRAKGALHVEIQPEIVRRAGPDGETQEAQIGALPDEFVSYLDRVPVEDLDKARLASMAGDYLTEARDAA